jgi:hypothetical protein
MNTETYFYLHEQKNFSFQAWATLNIENFPLLQLLSLG